jgi:hypothetical protein
MGAFDHPPAADLEWRGNALPGDDGGDPAAAEQAVGGRRVVRQRSKRVESGERGRVEGSGAHKDTHLHDRRARARP